MTKIPQNFPPELEALDRELGALDIEERASFGPELASELETEFRRFAALPERPRVMQRLAWAAAIGGILAVGAVPGVRASLVRTFEAAINTMGVSEPPTVAGRRIPVQMSVLAEEPQPEVRRVFIPMEENERVSDAPASWIDEPLDALAPEFAYPVLLDPEDAQRIVQMFYPRRLQDAGVGGEVRVMVWIDESGHTTDREVIATSSVEALDRAALSALGRLRFRPARRGGAPVGSWVKFNIKFEPVDQTGGADPGMIRETESVVVDAGGSQAVASKPN